MRHLIMLSLLLSLCVPSTLLAETATEQPDPYLELINSLQIQTGTILLPDGKVQLEVPESFAYIGPEDTRRFLEQGWGNPDGSGMLGMLLPVDVDLFAAEGWGVVISYDDDGHVTDDDAREIDYAELLTSMQEATEEANAERVKAGYDRMTLKGWAATPRYDEQSKKLYWAKELQFGDEATSTLNYNVRILGRQGVLVMNAVADMTQLPMVEERMQQVIAFTDFTDGNRYSDYDSGVDKVAAYGVAALVGGKLAAKAGLLAKLGGVLFALKKVLIAGGVALLAFLRRIIGRRKQAVAVTGETSEVTVPFDDETKE